MKILNITPIRKNMKQASVIKEIISTDEYIRILEPLHTFKKCIEDIQETSNRSVSKVLNIITGQDSTMANLANSIIKIAFGRGAVYKLPGEDGYSHDVSSVKFRGADPNKDRTIHQTKEYLYGEPETIGLPTMRAWMEDKKNPEYGDKKERLLSLMPGFPNIQELSPKDQFRRFMEDDRTPLPNTVQYDYARLINACYGRSRTKEIIKSLSVEDEDVRIQNFLNFYEELMTKVNALQKNLKNYVATTKKKLLDTKEHKVTMEEAKNYEKKYEDEKRLIINKIIDFNTLRKVTSSTFNWVPASTLQTPSYDPKGGFLNWDGGQNIFDQYITDLGKISNPEDFVGMKEMELRQIEEEIKKVEKSAVGTSEKGARLAELREKRNTPAGIISSYKGDSSKSIFNQAYCLYIMDAIKNGIKPALSDLEEINETKMTPIVAELNKLFSMITDSLKPKVKKDGAGNIIPSDDVVDKNAKYSVVDAYIEKIVGLNKKMNEVFKNTPRALILNNVQNNGNICQKKDQHGSDKQTKSDVARAQKMGTSGQDGDYLVKDSGVLDIYHDRANIKGKREPINKILVVPSTHKIDFQHVIQKGYGGISYVDLRNYLTVNEEIGEALIKYFIINQAVKISASTAKVIGGYLIGRSVSSAVEVIKESLSRCKNISITKSGVATIDPKCIADICEDISYKDAESISPLLIRVKPKLPTKEFITSVMNSQLSFVNKKLTQSMKYKQISHDILKIEDQLEEVQEALKIGEKTIDAETKKTLQSEVERLKHLKWDMEDDYETGLKLDNDRNFYCLTGKSAVGKTEWPKIVAQELGWQYYQVNLNQVKNKWVGESERRLHEFMEAVLRMKNVIVNFDEMDGQFFTPCSGGTSVDQSNTGMRTALQSFFEDHVEDFKARNIIFYGSTNNWSSIADAFKSRIHRVEWDTAIQPDTIGQIVKSSHLNALRAAGIEDPEKAKKQNYAEPMRAETEEAEYKRKRSWEKRQGVLKTIDGLSPDAIKQRDEQIIAMKDNIDFRYINDLSASIHAADADYQYFKKIIDAFNNDTTPNKEKWSVAYPVIYENWVSRGRPAGNPIVGYKGIAANEANIVRQYKSTRKEVEEQDGGKLDVNIESGQDEIVKEQVREDLGLPSAEEEKEQSEQLEMELGLQGKAVPSDEPGGVAGAPSVGAVEGVGTTKPTTDVNVKPGKEKQKLPSKKPTPVVPQQQQQEEAQEESNIQSSTDYFYNFLKKQGILQKNPLQTNSPTQVQTQPTVPLAKTTLTIDDVKDPFNIGEIKFVPFNL